MGRGQVLGPGWCHRPHIQYQAQSRAGWEPGGQGRQCSWAPVCSSGASSPCLPHSQMLQPGFEGNRAQAYSSTQDCLGLVLQPPAVLYPAWQPSPSLCVLRSYVRAAHGLHQGSFICALWRLASAWLSLPSNWILGWGWSPPQTLLFRASLIRLDTPEQGSVFPIRPDSPEQDCNPQARAPFRASSTAPFPGLALHRWLWPHCLCWLS